VVGLGVAAAAAVALVMFTPVGDDLPVGQHGRFRAGRGAAIDSRLPDDASLPRDRFVLRWSSGPPGTVYTLEVAQEDLTELWRVEELETDRYRVPPHALADLPDGTVVLWRIDALLPDTTRVSSPVFRARIR
jgi:hypothetical protein